MIPEFYELESRHIMKTYRRNPRQTIFVQRGKGARVWDESGKEYLDFVGGLAVNALGHCHPAVVQAVKEQVETISHTSNLYFTGPQVELASVMAEHSFGDRVFFSNSGAEANEAAIKLARKYSKQKYGEQKYKIITALDSFHGRTLATLSATAQPKYQKGFEPLVEGFNYATFNEYRAFARLVDNRTCAIMVEPVQGESGVYPADPRFLQDLRHLCDQEGLLLIFDEVQCGMGRTGRIWAYEHYGVEPDILTSAKALGGGLPIGAMVAREDVATGFGPGDHASTFGGNPVVCRAALAVWEVLLGEGFLEKAGNISRLLKDGLEEIKNSYPDLVAGIRGLGFMLAVELEHPAAGPVQQHCQENGLLVNAIGDKVLRLLPPYIIDENDIGLSLEILSDALRQKGVKADA